MDALNSIWPSINFTVAHEEEDRSIIFLDLKTKVDSSMTFEYEHRVKPTSSDRYLNFQYHCPISMKNNIVKMEAVRVIRSYSKLESIYPYLEKLRSNFIMSG